MTYSIFCIGQPKIVKKKKTIPRPLHTFKVEENSKTFQDLHRNLTTFQGKMESKDFSRTFPKIQGFFKTV